MEKARRTIVEPVIAFVLAFGGIENVGNATWREGLGAGEA